MDIVTNYIHYIKYGCSLYNGQFLIKNNILFIYIEEDEFKICLSDLDNKNFNKKITLYHRNRQNNLDGNRYWHIQRKDSRITFLLFLAFTHSIYKEIGIQTYTKEDYSKFLFDANRYKKFKY